MGGDGGEACCQICGVYFYRWPSAVAWVLILDCAGVKGIWLPIPHAVAEVVDLVGIHRLTAGQLLITATAAAVASLACLLPRLAMSGERATCGSQPGTQGHHHPHPLSQCAAVVWAPGTPGGGTGGGGSRGGAFSRGGPARPGHVAG